MLFSFKKGFVHSSERTQTRRFREEQALPIVVETVIVIQLQIVPDQVLLGNRDALGDTQKNK